jgi:hypothetical protein
MMAQLNVVLSDEELRDLRAYASRRQISMDWLIKEYVAYLLAGGRPVAVPTGDTISSDDLARLAEHGGAFDWLAEEPDLYGPHDGEPV